MELDYSVKPGFMQRLKLVLRNWRLLTFIGFFFVLFGSLGYTILSEVIGNGIHQSGGVAIVNLKALGQFPFDDQNGLVSDVPKPYRALDGKKISLVGYMVNMSSAGPDVSGTQLVWNVQKCCFGGPPLVQERVFLNPPTNRKVNRYSQDTLVNITGTLRVALTKNNMGTITSVYTLVPDSVQPQS